MSILGFFKKHEKIETYEKKNSSDGKNYSISGAREERVRRIKIY